MIHELIDPRIECIVRIVPVDKLIWNLNKIVHTLRIAGCPTAQARGNIGFCELSEYFVPNAYRMSLEHWRGYSRDLCNNTESCACDYCGIEGLKVAGIQLWGDSKP
jgi:hypothetical protein